MLKRLSCFQFQCASFSNSSHISAKHGVALFRSVPKYFRGEIYNRVLSSASSFLWSVHSGELAPQFGMISSTLPKASFCLVSFVFACLAIELTFPYPNQPLMLCSLEVTIALEQPAFASLCAYLGAQDPKDYMK